VASTAALHVANAACQGVRTMGSVLGDVVVENTRIGRHLRHSDEPHIQAARKVGVELVAAGYEVAMGVEAARHIVLENASDVTVDLVGHRYGEQAREATKQGAEVVQNAYKAMRVRKHMKANHFQIYHPKVRIRL